MGGGKVCSEPTKWWLSFRTFFACYLGPWSLNLSFYLCTKLRLSKLLLMCLMSHGRVFECRCWKYLYQKSMFFFTKTSYIQLLYQIFCDGSWLGTQVRPDIWLPGDCKFFVWKHVNCICRKKISQADKPYMGTQGRCAQNWYTTAQMDLKYHLQLINNCPLFTFLKKWNTRILT